MSETVQLMLTVTCAGETADPLAAALAGSAISCVLITPPGWQAVAFASDDIEIAEHPPYDQDQCRTLVDLVQHHNAAAIIANDAAAAQATGADGCHLDTAAALEENYRNARAFLGSKAIVGVMPGTSRHSAMTLAEAGTDYIGYSVSNVDDHAGLGFVAWWAEIFDSPVVAFTDGDVATCRHAIELGPPDFLAVPLLIDGNIDHLQSLSQLIEESGQLPIAAKDAK